MGLMRLGEIDKGDDFCIWVWWDWDGFDKGIKLGKMVEEERENPMERVGEEREDLKGEVRGKNNKI